VSELFSLSVPSEFHLGLVQKQMRSSGFRPASVERKSVERRSAFEVTTLYAQTLHALRVLAGHNVRITPKVWKLFLHELLECRVIGFTRLHSVGLIKLIGR